MRKEIENCNFYKTPPQVVDIEEKVLGALLIESEAIKKINLEVEDFYYIKHQQVFSAILELQKENHPIDYLTVQEQLRKNGNIENVGGEIYVALLTKEVCSGANLDYHSKIIKEKSIARKIIELCEQNKNKAFDCTNNISDVINDLDNGLAKIINGITAITDNFQIQIINTIEQYSEAANGKQKGIKTGFSALDKILNGGWQNSKLIIIGGRASMGKTQFAIYFARKAAEQGKRTMFISLEMPYTQIITRMICASGLNQYFVETGQLNREEFIIMQQEIAKIENLPFVLRDNIYTFSDIKFEAKKEKECKGLDFLIIDYLQLIETNQKFGTRDLEIGFITRQLKQLSRTLDIPVVLLAQLKRAENARVTEPKLQDLRESGNIEQDADVVLFPHRPTYYNKNAEDDNGLSWKNRGYLIVAKNREGERSCNVDFFHDEQFKNIWGNETPDNNCPF